MSERSFRERFKMPDILNSLLFQGIEVLTGARFDRLPKIAVIPLVAGVDTGGGIVSWVNPEGVAIIIDRAELDVTTIATAACSVSVGTTVASATTSVATLIDTCDVHSATGLFDNITEKGTNGKSRQKLAAGGWVTATSASGASAGLVGNLHLHYHLA